MTSSTDNERIARGIAEGMNRQRQAQERIRKAGQNREDEWDSDEETIQGENNWNAQAEDWEEEAEDILREEKSSRADADATEERQVEDQVPESIDWLTV